MKYYVVCPYCEHDLLKAENGSYVEISCPKCNEYITIEIRNDVLTIQKVLTNNT